MGIDPRCLNIKKIILALDFQNNRVMLINSKPFPASYTQRLDLHFIFNCIRTDIGLFKTFYKLIPVIWGKFLISS